VIGISFSFYVDNLMVTLRLELEFTRGFSITWTALDAHQAAQVPTVALDPRFLRKRFSGEAAEWPLKKERPSS
jgi:hypothetical protein